MTDTNTDTLVKRMRKARQFTVEIDGFTFTCRRPTQAEAAEMHQQGYDNHRIAATFVCGWKGVKESDLVQSGGGDEVEFTPAVWREWVADELRFWTPLADRILDEYTAHNKKEADAGNV